MFPQLDGIPSALGGGRDAGTPDGAPAPNKTKANGGSITLLTCGLIGLPGSGKTTLFSLLTGAAHGDAPGGQPGTTRVMTVPDQRVDTLARHFRPRKTTYAQIALTDVPGLVPGDRDRTARFLEEVREVDILAFVLADFDGERGSEARRDLAALKDELVLADLAMVEGRLARLEAGGRVGRRDGAVHAALRRLREGLESGLWFRDLDLGPEDAEAVSNMAFLTAKPAVVVENVSEEKLSISFDRTGPGGAADEPAVPRVTVSAQVEREISELSPEEAGAFLADLGLEEPGTTRLARAVYEGLGLVSFFTTGRDEVRAWTIRRGTRAKAAAGKIHSDIERGFIRAEVIAYQDYARAAAAVDPRGSQPPATRSGLSASLGERALTRAKEMALFRLEGKNYEVADGDIISFRFNV